MNQARAPRPRRAGALAEGRACCRRSTACRPRSRTRRRSRVGRRATARTRPTRRRRGERPCVDRLQQAGMVLLGKTTTPEFGWKALTDLPLQGTTRSPWNLKHSPGRLFGRRLVAYRRRHQSVQSRQRWRRLDPHSGRAHRPGRAKTILRPHRAVSRRFGLRRRDLPGRAVAHRARHGAGLERVAGPDPRDWRSLPAEPRDYTVGLEEGVRGLRLGFSLDLGQ